MGVSKIALFAIRSKGGLAVRYCDPEKTVLFGKRRRIQVHRLCASSGSVGAFGPTPLAVSYNAPGLDFGAMCTGVQLGALTCGQRQCVQTAQLWLKRDN